MTATIENIVEFIYAGLLTNEDSHLYKRLSVILLVIELYIYELLDDEFILMILHWHFTLGVSPENFDSISVCDPPANLFRIKCAAVMFSKSAKYLQNNDYDSFLFAVNYFQLYFQYKKQNPIWSSLSKGGDSTDPKASSNLFPIEVEELFNRTMEECMRYLDFTIFESYELALTAVKSLDASNHELLKGALSGKSGSNGASSRGKQSQQRMKAMRNTSAAVNDKSESSDGAENYDGSEDSYNSNDEGEDSNDDDEDQTTSSNSQKQHPGSSSDGDGQEEEDDDDDDLLDADNDELMQLDADLKQIISEDIKTNILSNKERVIITNIPQNSKVVNASKVSNSVGNASNANSRSMLISHHRNNKTVATIITKDNSDECDGNED